MIKSKLPLFILLIFALISCGKKESANNAIETYENKITFLKGDPASIIENTINNKKTFINIDNVNDFDNYSLNLVQQFTEKEILIQKKTEKNIEEGNEASENDETTNADKYLFKFEKLNQEEYKYTSNGIPFSFIFTKYNNQLSLTELRVDNSSYPLRAIHYSKSNSEDAFSILAESYDSTDGRILIAFNFVKKSEQKLIEKASTYYKYIFGPGIKINWDQSKTLNINICANSNSYKLNQIYQNAINSWSKILNGRLNIETKILTDYPPFNDLNNHCIYTIDNYQTEFDEDILNPGTTIYSANKFTGKILDSDIFIWKKENEKTGQNLQDVTSLLRTVTHELGHLLGLDHQFSGVESIMSYKQKDTSINAYDYQAIRVLYPINDGLSNYNSYYQLFNQ